jgi:hypothetical protein
VKRARREQRGNRGATEEFGVATEEFGGDRLVPVASTSNSPCRNAIYVPHGRIDWPAQSTRGHEACARAQVSCHTVRIVLVWG